MVSWVQRGGPLAEFADGYRDELACRGFTANSVVTHVVLMGQLSRWMAEVKVAAGVLTPARIQEFLDSRRAGGQRRVPTARVLDPARPFAGGRVVGPPLVGPATPLGDLLECYERHLVEDRGLAASTVVGYVGVARRFLSERASAAGDQTGVAGLCGGVVTAFLLRECGRLRSAPRRTGSPACGPCCASCALRAWWPPIWPPRCRRWLDGGTRRCRLAGRARRLRSRGGLRPVAARRAA